MLKQTILKFQGALGFLAFGSKEGGKDGHRGISSATGFSDDNCKEGKEPEVIAMQALLWSYYFHSERQAPEYYNTHRFAPARKPRDLQWHFKGRFICGRCGTTFTTRYAQTRDALNQHTEKHRLEKE